MEKRLPILATLVAAVQLCVDNFSFALRILTPWFIILLLVPNLIFAVTKGSSAVLGFTPWEFVEFALYTVGWGSIAVLWHWRILRDASQDRTSVMLDQRVWSYLVKGFLIGIIVGCIALISGILAVVVLRSVFELRIVDQILDRSALSLLILLPMGVVAVIITARLTIALPAIALKVPGFGLRDAWKSTAGNSIRLLLVTALPLVPLYVVGWILGLPSSEESDLYSFSPGPLLLQIVQQTIDFAFGLIGLTVLSITYAYFAENKEAGSVQPGS